MSVQKENFSKNVARKKKSFYRFHPYFNKDLSIEYAQSPVRIRYYNAFGGRYIKERDTCDLDQTLDRSNNCECTQVDVDYANVCAFLDTAPVANEADRADDRLLSASFPHPSRNPRIPGLHVDV